MKICIGKDCDREQVARSMCKKHWRRWRNGKDINEKTWCEKTTKERFFEKVDKSGDCWLWTGGTRGNDDLQYGTTWVDGKHESAHRYSWVLHNGEIPSGGDCRGMCVCHTCDTPLCVNPDHLFLGTHTDNMRDKIDKGRCGNKNKTHCPQGHEYSEENTYTSKRNMRHCKECARIREAKRRLKLKGDRHG